MKQAFLAVFLSLSLFAHAEEKPAPASEPPSDFVRFREDDKGAQLQTGIATYRNAEGVVVELIGAIHIGDKAYYEALNKRFTYCERLLYEMVGEELEPVKAEKPAPPSSPASEGAKAGDATQDPASAEAENRRQSVDEFLSGNKRQYRFAPKPTPAAEAGAEKAARERMRWLHPLYDTLKNTLKLESQMEGIDYSKGNFVHADMTARQFAAMQQKRGEGFLQMWWRAVQAQMAQPEIAPQSPGLLKILEILCRPDSPTELKRVLGRMFDQVEKLMAGMETEQGSVIVVERNKVAIEVMKKEIATGRRHLGIFYGAAHLPDLEERLLAMGFKREKLEWLTAWDLPPEPKPMKVEP